MIARLSFTLAAFGLLAFFVSIFANRDASLVTAGIGGFLVAVAATLAVLDFMRARRKGMAT